MVDGFTSSQKKNVLIYFFTYSITGRTLSTLPIKSTELYLHSSLATQYPEEQRDYLTQNLEYYEVGKERVLVSDFMKYGGDNPPLQRINTEGHSMELENFLFTFRYLTIINLSHTQLGKAGYSLAQSIKSSGDESPLKELSLKNCSLSATVTLEFVQSLSKCKHLTILNLSGNILQEVGHTLVQSITSWGNDPPLKQLFLHNCSMPVHAVRDLVQSLSACRKLTHLDLGRNNLGEAGHHLAMSIRSWGHNSSLQELYLYNSLMPMNACIELIQVLSRSKQFTHLDLGENFLVNAGYFLALLIRSWENDPPFEELHLFDCLMPLKACTELVQCLSKCRNLTYLQLGKNFLGKVGHQLAKTISYWGDNPPLKQLHLYDCSISREVISGLLKSLSTCKCLTHLNLGKNLIGTAGYNLAQSITYWGNNPQLQELILMDCEMPSNVTSELLESLWECKRMKTLDLSGNILDESGLQLAESIHFWGDEPPLQRLYLGDCSMPADVWNVLFQALLVCRNLNEFDAPKDILNNVGYDIPKVFIFLMQPQFAKFKLAEVSSLHV